MRWVDQEYGREGRLIDDEDAASFNSCPEGELPDLTDPATLMGSYSPGDTVDAATAQTIARAVFDAVLAFTP